MKSMMHAVVALVVGVIMMLSGNDIRAQQSDNTALHTVPPPGAVVIDGKLDDWDLSGQFEVFANYRTRSTYSTKVAAMYDKEFFYLSIVWRDPTPLQNMVDATFEVGSGWKSDCVQLRVKTDAPMHIDCWYSTTAKKPVINIQYGAFEGPDKNKFSNQKLVGCSAPNAIDLGAKEGFTVGEDGKSYTQEIAIPWKLITGANILWKEGNKPISERTEYKAGEQFQMGMEFLWGGPDGRTFPIHRYADLVRVPGAMREFFWTAERDWGPVIMEPKGNLKLPAPDYTARAEVYLQKTAGQIELNYTMPFDGFATLVIEDEKGIRVRNLIGMATRAKGKQVDFWDCTDEQGKLVAPGKYRFRGLAHQGVDPVYDATYGSPGIPPWDTGDGTGAWMSDHCAPRTVAASPAEMMVLGAERGESGYGLVGCDLNGKKKWGDRTLHGVHSVGADADYAYIFLSSWDVKPVLARMEIKTGKYAPFATEKGAELKVPVFTGDEKPVWIPNFAVGTDRIAVPLPNSNELSRIRFFDKKTAAMVAEMPVPRLGCVAYDPAGTLYVWSDGKVNKVVDGKLVPVITADLPEWTEGMAVDTAGQIYLTSRKTNQVKVYGKDGKFMRDIGMAGGRSKTGVWNPNGLLNPLGIAVDSQGRLWVAEEDSSPKRISVWGADGKLVKDFIGPTGYGGTGANADPDDKTRVFGSGCEFKLDYDANKADVVACLGDVAGQFIRKDGREYFMSKGGRLYLRTGNSLRMVAAIGNPGVKDLGNWKDIPVPPVPDGTHGYASMTFVWSDMNDDGVAQTNEVVSGSRWAGWTTIKYPVGTSGYFGSYWLDDQFAICAIAGESHGAYGGRPTMISKTSIKSWTKGGAPIWDTENQKLLSSEGKVQGCLYMSAEGKTVAGSPLTCVSDDGTVLWTYKDNWAGVHASHHAPIPDRDDMLIGTLGCVGHAKTAVGRIFAMHSNMGRMTLMTMDGLFVANVFQDCRLGSDPWPTDARKGAPLGGVTMGSEWFGGHFFQAKSGEYYLIAGFTAYNLIKLNGLDTLQAISGEKISVSEKDLKKAEEMEKARVMAAAAAEKRELILAKAEKSPVMDGKLEEYGTNNFVQWSSGPYKMKAALTMDATNLYLAYDVSGDDNPMVNNGKDVNQLFVTGDSVDFQLGTDAGANGKREDAAVGDIRLLMTLFEGKPVAVLYRWKVKGEKAPVTFTCPWRSHTVDRVDVLKDAVVNIAKRGGGYVVEASVPLATLGFAPEAGKAYKGDMGVIFSDSKGDNRAARVYWSNKATGLVADVPGEIMATPNMWGTVLCK